MEKQLPSFLTKEVTRRSVLGGLLGLAASPLLLQACMTPSANPSASKTPSPALKTAPAAGPVTLKWQTANLTEAQYEPIWKEMVAKFQVQNPTITIEPILVARKDHWTKFVTAAKANQAPDVVSVDISTGVYNGYLLPFDDLWAAEPESYRKAWTEDALVAGRYKGKLYGLPSWGGIYAEFYNKDLVQKAGLDIAKPPATWDEYLNWAKRLTTQDRWATTILGGPTDTTTRVLLSWIWSNGGDIFNPDMTATTFASNAKTLEAIKYYLDLELVHKVTAPGSVNINYLEQTVLFAQEKIATMRNAYWAVAKVAGDNPAIKQKIAVAFPPMHGNNRATMVSVTCDSISKDCKNPEAAWKWIKFVNDREWSIKRAKIANWLPLRTDLIDDPEVKQDPLLAQFLEYGKVAKAYPLNHPLWADIAATDVVSTVQAALLKRGSVEELFGKLDETLAKKFKEM
ncbi:MAG: sugar transporter substrate-binding protein [Firmicutes bacterium]|nr:sugar transporter substrate-binding protein [Bacillota bacterium]